MLRIYKFELRVSRQFEGNALKEAETGTVLDIKLI